MYYKFATSKTGDPLCHVIFFPRLSGRAPGVHSGRVSSAYGSITSFPAGPGWLLAAGRDNGGLIRPQVVWPGDRLIHPILCFLLDMPQVHLYTKFVPQMPGQRIGAIHAAMLAARAAKTYRQIGKPSFDIILH